MAATAKGVKSSVIPQSEASGAMDRYGVDTLTQTEEIPTASFPASMKAMGSTHASFTSMAVSKINYTRAPHALFYRVTYTYEGYLIALPDPTYELDISLSEEPIQTNPDFVTFAGTPSAPLNGAIFIDPDTGKPTTDDNKGIWKEFKVATAGVGSVNKKAGVDSYVAPGATWTKVYFSKTKPSAIGSIGKIDTPDGSPPTLSDGATWLYWALNYRKRGSLYEIRKVWKASSRGGWDTDIY